MKTRKILQSIGFATILFIAFIIQDWAFNTMYKNIPKCSQNCWDIILSMTIDLIQTIIVLILLIHIISIKINKD